MSSIMKFALVTVIYFSARMAMAAGGGDGVPVELVTKQVINFSLFVLLIGFLTKNAIKNHFKNREEEFTQYLRKAQAAKEEAEAKKKAIKERLTKLEQNASEGLEQAKAEAEEIKHKLLADAETLAKKLEEEAHRSAKVEYEKALFHLREELLENSVKLAESTLRDKVDTTEQKRLQSEFVEKIQVVQ